MHNQVLLKKIVSSYKDAHCCLKELMNHYFKKKLSFYLSSTKILSLFMICLINVICHYYMSPIFSIVLALVQLVRPANIQAV